MSKYISSKELWDNVCKEFAYPQSPRGKKNIDIQKEYGDIHFNHYSTGFGIIYSSITAIFIEDTIIENTNSYDSYFLSFNTGHDVYMKDTFNEKEMQWKSNICLNGKQYAQHSSQVRYKKGKKAIIHYIGFGDKLFKELIANNEAFKNSELMYRSNYIDVYFNNTITIQQEILLNDLLKTAMIDDKIQMLYLESKLLDLIYISLNSIENITNDIYLSNKDIECLTKAKEILIENFENPPSVKELAYKCALNEFKLKKGFKQLFKNTVYGFLQEYRLNIANNLLKTKEINVSEASSLVGYKCKSHFSKIFKDYFGISPLQLKRETNIYTKSRKKTK